MPESEMPLMSAPANAAAEPTERPTVPNAETSAVAALAEPVAAEPVAGTSPPAAPTEPSRQQLPGSASGAVSPVPAGYEYLGTLGRGGMGIVYKARQISSGRIMAIKTLIMGSPTEVVDPAHSAGLRAEADLIIKLNHPNIVAIHEVGEHNGRPYLALEYVGGGTLEDMLAQKPLSIRRAAELIESLARATAAVHAQGIIHRDLKPSNVLLTAEGVPKIADFGLSKWLEASNSATATGVVKGTPNYMSPEQASGNSKRVTPATDVYGLGAILYEMLTGRPPFDEETPLKTILAVASNDPISPSTLVSDVAGDMEIIVLKCLAKNPAERYPTAEQLADDLRAFLDGRRISARPLSFFARWAGWWGRWWGVIVIGLTVVGCLAAILLSSWLTKR